MALINEIQKILHRLAPAGWRQLLLDLTNGDLDITVSGLKQELTKNLKSIDRSIEGFQDFAAEGHRAIEQGWPALSLLYHALASPSVIRGLKEFPTLAELDVVENYIFSLHPIRAEDVKRLAIVVFACEYRPAQDTVHSKHADLCFSRIGIARTGTVEPRWDPPRRHFNPLVAQDIHAFRVMPARYVAYLATRSNGNRESFGPMRFQDEDSSRNFWVPVHKLFDGTECIQGCDLKVTFSANHIHQKLKKFHETLNARGYDSGWKEPDIANPPFVLSEGLAELSNQKEFGPGVLCPVPHTNLVEGAKYKNKPLTFKFLPDFPKVSGGLLKTLGSSLWLLPQENARLAPEFVNVRHEILPNGNSLNLNTVADVDLRVKHAGYTPQHFIDYTADGWIAASVDGFKKDSIGTIAAYSLITPPSFFPYCNQRELMDWCVNKFPDDLAAGLWAEPPRALCDRRYAANITLKGAGFELSDDTVPAIVSQPYAGLQQQRPLNQDEVLRPSYMPDAAAGVFDPGWDSTISHGDERKHVFLENYGLGTPFLEDAKLCAAFGSFWPAVAPDATREFEPLDGWPTVTPLTDEEIGMHGNIPWDGVSPPELTTWNGKRAILYSSFDHSDYIDNKLTAHLTSQVNAYEYKKRVLAMAVAYWALGIDNKEYLRKYKDRIKAFGHIVAAKAKWCVLSFQKMNSRNPKLEEAEKQTSTKLDVNVVYSFQIYKHGRQSPDPKNPRRKYVEIAEMVDMFLDFQTVLAKTDDHPWKAKQLIWTNVV